MQWTLHKMTSCCLSLLSGSKTQVTSQRSGNGWGLLAMCLQGKSSDDRTYGYCHNIFNSYLLLFLWQKNCYSSYCPDPVTCVGPAILCFSFMIWTELVSFEQNYGIWSCWSWKGGFSTLHLRNLYPLDNSINGFCLKGCGKNLVSAYYWTIFSFSQN